MTMPIDILLPSISIHAPARGATLWRGLHRELLICISIHAPAWGATDTKCSIMDTERDFNPRSRMGSDVNTTRFPVFQVDFNPRSRMGSDPLNVGTSAELLNFNPRSRMGSDIIPIDCRYSLHRISIHAPAWGATQALHYWGLDQEFQSTLPHGERLTTRGAE